MKIAVVIPTFNRANHLIRAIDSVLAQEYVDFELYVVDDGSTDNTKEQIQKFLTNPKCHYIYQNNSGVSAARNTGIKASDAEWVAFLDSDDEWLPHKLKTQTELLKLNPEIRFIHSNEIWVRNGQRVNPKIKFDKSNDEIFKRSLATCLISPSTVLMRRSLGEEFGFFDQGFEICEDYDLWLKILVQEEILFVSDYLTIKHGGHEDQLSLKYPAMDLWRIRSLKNLLTHSKLTDSKKKLIIQEINQKGEILLRGLLKHQRMQDHADLLVLISETNKNEND